MRWARCRIGWGASLVAAWLVSGCGVDAPSPWEASVVSALVVSASDEAPRPLDLKELEESGDRQVDPVDLSGVSGVWSLRDGVALVEASEGVWRVAADLSLGDAPIPGFPGRVHEVAPLEEGMFLVASGDGLHVGDALGAQLSPVEAALEGASVHAVSVSEVAVWMTSDKGLHRWADGQIQTLELPGIDCRDAQIVHGPPLHGKPALWIASEGRVAGLVQAVSGFQAEIVREGHPVDRMVADGEGHLWTLAGGRLHRREPSGVWRLLRLDAAVAEVRANPGASPVWIQLADGGIVQGSAGAFRVLVDLPAGALSAADDEGNAWLWGDALHRVVPGRPITLSGIGEGALVYSAMTVRVDVAFADQVESLEARVGDQGLPVEDFDGHWEVTLDPAITGFGPQVLEVTASFADGAPDSQATLGFVAEEPPTWGEDVQPIYQASCSPCHSSSYSVHPLDSPELWANEIDSILWMVSRGLMPEKPYSPLTSEEVALVEAWADAGFPE